jgi:hypothetical protein
MRNVALFAFALSACGSGGACEDLASAQCDLCELNDTEEVYCTCLENGTLTKNDAPDGFFETDQDAEMACSSFRYELQYSSDDYDASCRADVAMFDEYGKDYCDFGYGGYYPSN